LAHRDFVVAENEDGAFLVGCILSVSKSLTVQVFERNGAKHYSSTLEQAKVHHTKVKIACFMPLQTSRLPCDIEKKLCELFGVQPKQKKKKKK